MKKNGKKRTKRAGGKGWVPDQSEEWFVYILQCRDFSLYTGITKNIEKRFETHSKGKGARYTRGRRPLELVYHERRGSKTEALVRESVLKSLPRREKLALIDKFKNESF